jgi:hypothetical protein
MMQGSELETLRQVARQFRVCGELVQVEPVGIGHINRTYTATYADNGRRTRYVHQRINRNVFRNPRALMENLERVCQHLQNKLQERGEPDPGRRCLTLVPTHDGASYWVDAEGEFWRTYVCIEGVRSCDAVSRPERAWEVGRAFGEFQALLADLPGPRLHDTIPDFHHTRKRFEAFCRALERDPVNRARHARREIEFALAHEPLAGVVLDALEQGRIPERITHNDTKINNVLLDEQTHRAVAVVDLDTVMTGSVLYDFGDMVRTATSPTPEDERDLTRVRVQLPFFEKLVEGYLSTAGSFLTAAERDLLVASGKLITFETGLRFLTDYLLGDTYFRVHRPDHNLDRCRAQFQLLASLEAGEEALQAIVRRMDNLLPVHRP